MNIAQAIYFAAQQLQQSSDSPRLDAEILLAFILSVNRSYLYTWPEKELTAANEQALQQLITTRQSGMPVAYLVGQKEFWSMPLLVNEDTLIPRPETELLVNLGLEKMADYSKPMVADLGTGSGAIALAFASERPNWLIYATDLHANALNIAKKNAEMLTINNVIFCESDWCRSLPVRDFNMIVSNPPYLAANDPHLQNEIRFEPHYALVADDNGLSALRTIIRQAHDYLIDGGWLLLEHGYQQADEVAKLLLQCGYQNVACRKDLAGNDRVSLGRK